MGLRETIQNAAVTAFNAIGNIKVSVTYTSVGAKTYDASAGTHTSTNTDYTVDVVFDNTGEMDMSDRPITSNMTTCMIPVSDLTPTPKKGDKITRDSVEWEVIDTMTDPADALWTFMLKKP